MKLPTIGKFGLVVITGVLLTACSSTRGRSKSTLVASGREYHQPGNRTAPSDADFGGSGGGARTAGKSAGILDIVYSSSLRRSNMAGAMNDAQWSFEGESNWASGLIPPDGLSSFADCIRAWTGASCTVGGNLLLLTDDFSSVSIPGANGNSLADAQLGTGGVDSADEGNSVAAGSSAYGDGNSSSYTTGSAGQFLSSGSFGSGGGFGPGHSRVIVPTNNTKQRHSNVVAGERWDRFSTLALFALTCAVFGAATRLGLLRIGGVRGI